MRGSCCGAWVKLNKQLRLYAPASFTPRAGRLNTDSMKARMLPVLLVGVESVKPGLTNALAATMNGTRGPICRPSGASGGGMES